MEPSHKLFTSEAFKEHTAFWKQAFQTATEDFAPPCHWRSVPNGERESSARMEFSDRARARLEELGKRQDLGVFVIVSSALIHLLQLYRGANWVQVDTPPLGRGNRARMIGESVPLIARQDPTADIRAWIKQVGQTISASYSYQDFPFADLPTVLLERDRPPRTHVLFSFANIHAASAPPGYDWVIQLERGPGLALKFAANRGTAPEFLQLLLRQLNRLCEDLMDVDRPLADWNPLEAREERRFFLEALTTNRREFPQERTIHQWFERQAKNLPGKEAVRTPGNRLTYGELNDQANRLAQYLRKTHGLRPGETAALLCDRSELAIIGLLAILKTGGAYLPLDPGFPAKRLQFMIRDAGARVLLVHSNFLPQLAGLYETPMFALDLQLRGLEPARLPPVPMVSSSAAYMIYTSGSTGQPKGVVLEHRAFVNMIHHHLKAFQIGEEDRVSQFYAFAFDSSLFEIFAALLSGATLIMATREIIEDAALFAEYLESHEVTLLTLPPIYLNALDRKRLGAVRTILTAGDVARVEDALHYGGTGVYFNSYGPTEAAVCASHFRVREERPLGPRVPIGKAISNTAMFLMDQALRPVATGLAGEICISGAGLARGYLNRPDLTAAALAPDPYQVGGRLYKSGDLGVMLTDGDIELIGRADQQVKIRGFRIELGEIEAVLSGHERVSQAAVLAKEDASGEKRLVAYLAPDRGLEAEELRNHLKARLPEYMVPTFFVFLDQMPLTANGKIDRKALPEPERNAEAGDAYHAPTTDTESTLATIWAEVLGVDRPGIHDNFFELGGDSILIIQMVARAHAAGIKLVPKQLTEFQTIAELARVAQDASPIQAENEPASGPLPLLPIQHWFFAQKLANPHHYNQSVLLQTPMDLDITALRRAWTDLCRRHDGLRARVVDPGGEPSLQIDEAGDETAFFVEAVDDLEERAAFHQSDFNLETGPLARLVLFQDSLGRSTRLLIVIHHLLVDGVSWRILVEDFLRLYKAHARGQPPELPPKSTSLRRWAGELGSYRMEDKAEIAFWERLVERPEPRLPTDAPPNESANKVSSQAKVETSLDAGLTHSLLREAPRAYHTQINDLLLSALLLAVSDWSGEHALLLDMESHGREDLIENIDLSRTLGWFTSLYPVYLERTPGSDLGALIRNVKERLRAIPRNGLGYGLLRWRKAIPPANAKILFNYLGQTDRVLAEESDWRPAEEGRGPEQSPQNQRSHWLEISCMIRAGCLRSEWVFSQELHRHARVQRLAEGFQNHLESLIRHCLGQKQESFTPSDFPDAQLDQEALDGLIAKLKS